MIFKKWFSGIFGFFFLRSTIAIVALATLILLILFPFFKTHLMEMVKVQGASFANTTIAATSRNLYRKEFGDVLLYVQTVLKNTPDIFFVVISDDKGQEIVITKKKWRLEQNSFNYSKINFPASSSLLIYPSKSLIEQDTCFLYHQKISITDRPWGVLSVGMSDQKYRYILNRYFLTITISSALLVIILLILFFRNAKKIRMQIGDLSKTALDLQEGNLDTKAREDAIGEIGTLGIAINMMSSSIKEKSESLFQLAQIVKQTNDTFILFDESLKIVFVNDAANTLTGFPASTFDGMSLKDFVDMLSLDSSHMLDDIKWMREHKRDLPPRDLEIVRKDNQVISVEMRLESIRNERDDKPSYLIVLSNISERKILEHELNQLAFYDILTGLPNRRMFLDSIQKTVKSSSRNDKTFALFFIDLDNFKDINDTLGHEAGDSLLIEVGKRLKDMFREGDTVSRLGGDEFTVIIENVKQHGLMDIGHLASKVVNSLSKNHIQIADKNLTISISLGIAKFPEDGTIANELIKNADMAMYSAKQSGKNQYAFFSKEMNATLHQHLEMEQDLRNAVVANDQINLFYQPVIQLDNKKLIGVEGLARWKHPTKGLIQPDMFVPAAEVSDLIVDLSQSLLNAGFNQAAQWKKQGFDFYVSLNVSMRHFNKHNFIDEMSDLLNAYPVNAQNIQLEFTEGIMLDIKDETVRKFETLKEMGFLIAIDDFGIGYSSLSYIHRLPIDTIKIDRSFIMGLLDSEKTRNIIAAISSLSNSLGMKTIAEGVELKEHVEILKNYHYQYGQGYLFDPALPIDEFNKKYCQPNLPK